MSDNRSVLPGAEAHRKEEEMVRPDVKPSVSETVRDARELPEGWEPLPRDPNYKNPAYQAYRYQGVTLTSINLELSCAQRLPTFRGRSSDVLVISFPKSGTTWLMEIVWRVVHRETGPESGAGVPIEHRFPLLGVGSADSLLETTDLRELADPRLIKSHLHYHRLPESVLTSGAKTLYVSRDPRDVCVSMYHFSRMFKLHQYGGTFAQFRDSFVRGETLRGPYRKHVQGYQEHSDTVLCVTYEQMHQDRAAVVRRVAAFLDRPLTEDQVEAIVRYTDFQAMKGNPATNFHQWHQTGMALKDQGTFMRKGVAGDWRNYFTQEESDNFMSQLL